MVTKLILERILADIKNNVKELRDARDITWEIYRKRAPVPRHKEIADSPGQIQKLRVSAPSSEAGEMTTGCRCLDYSLQPTDYRPAFSRCAEDAKKIRGSEDWKNGNWEEQVNQKQ